MTPAEEPADGHVVDEESFRAALAKLTLKELQDVFAHLDREAYPGRVELVRKALNDRIEKIGQVTDESDGVVPAGAFRRLWGSILDVFVSLFPLVLVLGFRLLAASSGGGGGGRGGRGGGRGRGGVRGGRGRGGGQEPEANWYDPVVDYLTDPDAILATVTTYGPYILGFMAYRALYTLPQLMKSGILPGGREAGVRVVSADGKQVGLRQAVARFLSAYVLGFLTLGISHLWALWDRGNRTLFDRVSGTMLIRTPRTWEKSEERRAIED